MSNIESVRRLRDAFESNCKVLAANEDWGATFEQTKKEIINSVDNDNSQLNTLPIDFYIAIYNQSINYLKTMGLKNPEYS